MSDADAPRAIAINVGANTNLPGVRGPIYPDGRFVYVPIPERAPTRADADVPTYRDLDLGVRLPPDALDRRVHLDPEFAEYPRCRAYTYGDEHGVKAGPLSRLDPGDWLLFYATLDARAGTDKDPPEEGGRRADRVDRAHWIAPGWGAYLVGAFHVECVLTGEEWPSADPVTRERFANNAHVKRERFDAGVLVAGGPASRLFDRAVPLSTRTDGNRANRLVTALSNDSGKGPWWRRRLWFDPAATKRLLAVVADRSFEDPTWWASG